MTQLLRRKRDVLPQTRYVELFLVVDNERFDFSNRNQTAVREEMVQLANYIDSMYIALNIRIVLVGLEIWNLQNKINIDGSAGEVLGRFVQWREKELAGRRRHDSAQLILKKSFGGTAGMAFVGTVCSRSHGGGINAFPHNNVPMFASIVAHELGHNLGMNHDDGRDCHCGVSACVMNSGATGSRNFSTCSSDDFEKLIVNNGGSCLLNLPHPDEAYSPPFCGNKLVDVGEECDCGSPKECEKDSCCEAKTCKLKRGAQCAYGVCCKNCQTDLPEYYQPWMEIAKHVPSLIENRQIRSRVNEMPLLSTVHLQGHREQRLAHLALGFITMGYVWQEGALPRSLAVPYCEVSELLGLPPILVYADVVLANWKRKDPNGNLDTIFTFPGGNCARGFFLVSLIVETAAATGIKAIATALNSMSLHDTNSLHEALLDIAKSLNNMREAFKLMHGNVDPEEFYGQLRTFLHGWRDNPLLPEGMLYEGVWEEPKHYSGGSAAQSSAIQCFDEFLGIRHGFDYDAPYLYRMRDYMPPAHRALIQAIAAGPSARHHIIATGSAELCHAYNNCVTALVELRNYHINTVVKYITIPANKGKVTSGCIFQIHSSAEAERGTGGTGLMCFLKSVRDTTRRVLINDI
ncbi:UNVERIFIED_CONTAM: hypothetical protein FKN15_063645 [Acipenser sinensis]